MMTNIKTTSRGRVGLCLALAVLIGLPLMPGCLDEPEIDDRWTLIEFLSTDPVHGEDLTVGQPLTVKVSGQITYRAIRTGFLVAEVRFSDTLGPAALAIDPDDHSLDNARRVENVLDNSVTAGRGTRAVTGFDHLMQTIDFEFDSAIPADLYTGDPDLDADRGLFLVLYLAEGEEIELQGGRDSLVVTPFPVDEYELLFTGFSLDVLNPAAGSTP